MGTDYVMIRPGYRSTLQPAGSAGARENDDPLPEEMVARGGSRLDQQGGKGSKVAEGRRRKCPRGMWEVRRGVAERSGGWGVIGRGGTKGSRQMGD